MPREVSCACYDPQATPNTQRVLPASTERVKYCRSSYEAGRGAQALVLTKWEESLHLDLVPVRALVEAPSAIDGRNCLHPAVRHHAGFEYLNMGSEGTAAAGVGISSGTKIA